MSNATGPTIIDAWEAGSETLIRPLRALQAWFVPADARARDRRQRIAGRVLDGIAEGLSIHRACAAARGARYSTFMGWKGSEDSWGELLRDAYEEAYELGTQHLEDLALDRVESGDPRADRLLELLLKARRPHVYSEKRDVRIAGTIEERKVLVLPAEEAEVLAVEEARAVGAE